MLSKTSSDNYLCDLELGGLSPNYPAIATL